MQNPENLKNRDPFWQLLKAPWKVTCSENPSNSAGNWKGQLPTQDWPGGLEFLVPPKLKKIRVKSARLKFFHVALTPLIFEKLRASNFKNLPFARFQLFGWMIPFSCAKSMSWALALSARNASILLIISLLSGFLLAPLFVLRVRGSLEQLESGNWLAEKAENGWAVFCFEFFGAPI